MGFAVVSHFNQDPYLPDTLGLGVIDSNERNEEERLSQEERPVVAAAGTRKEPLGLLVMGAGLIVANWVVFGIIAGEWNTGAVYVALALLVLLSAYGIGGISISPQTRRVIGLFFGLVALAIVISDLRYDQFPDEAIDWIAYILFTAGAVLMFVGARQVTD